LDGGGLVLFGDGARGGILLGAEVGGMRAAGVMGGSGGGAAGEYAPTGLLPAGLGTATLIPTACIGLGISEIIRPLVWMGVFYGISQMAILHLRHLNGKEGLEKFTAAIAEFYDGNVVRQITISTNLLDSHVRLENIAARVLTAQLPIKRLAELLSERPYLHCRQMTVGFDQGERIQYSTDEVLATIEITPPSHMPPERFGDLLIRMTDVLGRHLTLTRKPEILNEHLTSEQKEGLRYYERALSDLTAQADQLGRIAAVQTQESQKFLDQKVGEMENRYEQRVQGLEADWHARNEAVDRREQELEKRYEQRVLAVEPDYQAKRQELDRREEDLERRYEQRSQGLEAEYQAKRQELDRRSEELKQQAEQQTRVIEADCQAKRQELDRRSEELKQQAEQHVQILEADYQAKKQDVERREKELENRYEQRLRALDAEQQVRNQDVERREKELEKRHEQRGQVLEADHQAAKQELGRREQELEKQYEQRVQVMEGGYQAKLQEVDRRGEELKQQAEQRVEAVRMSHQSRGQELDRREEQLKQQAEQLDAQSTAVNRRELVKKMQAMIEQEKEAKTSPQTEQKRKIIDQVCISVLGGFGSLLVFLVIWIAGWKQVTWHTLLPLGVVTIGFGCTLAFYLRFNNQWFAEHARAEFASRKLGSDFLRANWIAELFLESKENSKLDLPDGLLRAFAQGLFAEANGDTKGRNPVDQMVRGAKNPVDGSPKDPDDVAAGGK